MRESVSESAGTNERFEEEFECGLGSERDVITEAVVWVATWVEPDSEMVVVIRSEVVIGLVSEVKARVVVVTVVGVGVEVVCGLGLEVVVAGGGLEVVSLSDGVDSSCP